MLIPNLEASPPAGYQDSAWREPHIKRMRDEWDGFIEVRKTGHVQYRLIGRTEDRYVFLVACAIHKGQNYEINVSSQTALTRVQQMKNVPARYRREHEYN